MSVEFSDVFLQKNHRDRVLHPSICYGTAVKSFSIILSAAIYCSQSLMIIAFL